MLSWQILGIRARTSGHQHQLSTSISTSKHQGTPATLGEAAAFPHCFPGLRVILSVPCCEIFFFNVPGTSGSPDKLLWLQLPAVSTVRV